MLVHVARLETIRSKVLTYVPSMLLVVLYQRLAEGKPRRTFQSPSLSTHGSTHNQRDPDSVSETSDASQSTRNENDSVAAAP